MNNKKLLLENLFADEVPFLITYSLRLNREPWAARELTTVLGFLVLHQENWTCVSGSIFPFFFFGGGVPTWSCF